MYNDITGIMFLYIILHLAGVACKDCIEPGGKKEERRKCTNNDCTNGCQERRKWTVKSTNRDSGRDVMFNFTLK